MDPSSLILGNAIEEGNGGLVVLWSQDYTMFGGQVQVKGGALKGNGGILETSSKNDLSSFGFVDTSSPLGELGTWLLDPANVTVNSSSRCISQCGTPCKCSSSSQSVDCSSTAGQNVSICSNYNAFTISGNPPLNVPACNANIVIQATYGIYVESTISIQKGSLTFSPCSDSPGELFPSF